MLAVILTPVILLAVSLPAGIIWTRLDKGERYPQPTEEYETLRGQEIANEITSY